MKRYGKLFLPAFNLLLTLFLDSGSAKASENIDCDGPQASHPMCALAVAPNGRCGEQQAMQWNCANATDGCVALGGCFGSTHPGLWYTFSENGKTFRCKCGCFAEQTKFATASGSVTGTQLIEHGAIALQALETLDSGEWIEREINDVLWGAEHEQAYQLATASGKRIVLSRKHPVLIGDRAGKTVLFKTADQVKVGEIVVGSDGTPDELVSVTPVAYEDRMVNFVVKSNNPVDHIVDANGLKMGDNAWQQRLASEEARMLDRTAILRELMQQ